MGILLPSLSGDGMANDLFHVDPHSSVWSLLALPDADLERVDVVILNLAVARGIDSLKELDVKKYTEVVDGWTRMFSRWYPEAERRNFRKAPERWRNDIRFFRVGALAGFLGSEIGTTYIREQRDLEKVVYTNPSDLFLNGVIDTKRGTCGNLAALHVAMARRMGWTVSLACAASHFISRFDDGQVVHNIEMTETGQGSFASESDQWYADKFHLPRKAIECGSDLRSLAAREMLAAFIALRGRHHSDIRKSHHAESDLLLSRHLFPQHRKTFIRSVYHTMKRGYDLFLPHEVGHPDVLQESLAEEKMLRGVNGAATAPSHVQSRYVPEVVTALGCFSSKSITAAR
jgi:hypothetical protein